MDKEHMSDSFLSYVLHISCLYRLYVKGNFLVHYPVLHILVN